MYDTQLENIFNEMKKMTKKMKKIYWLIIFGITIITTMWIYGNVVHYFPIPLYIGFGQYLDIGTGIIIVSLLLLGFIIGVVFKKEKKKNKGER